CPSVPRINDGWPQSRIVANPSIVEPLNSHDPSVPGNANDADAVIARGSDGARHMGAVAKVIGRVIRGSGEIPTAHVINLAVVIVINAVPRYLTSIDPHIGRNVWMDVVNTCIYDSDNHSVAERCAPSRSRVDLIQSPEVLICLSPSASAAEKGIVGQLVRGVDVLQLRELDLRIGVELFHD